MPDFHLVLVELGSGWGAVKMESDVEYNFIEKHIRTDQNQEYWIDGSLYDETQRIPAFPSFSFQLYSPRQSGKTCIV